MADIHNNIYNLLNANDIHTLIKRQIVRLDKIGRLNHMLPAGNPLEI